MSTPNPAHVLASRLRDLADEIESADRYGVTVPPIFTVTSFRHDAASFAATPEEFDAWVDYTEAEVVEYDTPGRHGRRAVADVNGLRLTFATSEPIAAEVTA